MDCTLRRIPAVVVCLVSVVALATLGALVPSGVGASVMDKPRLPTSCDKELGAELEMIAAFEEIVGVAEDDNDLGIFGALLEAFARGESGESEFGLLIAAEDRMFEAYGASFGPMGKKCAKTIGKSGAKALKPCLSATLAALDTSDEIDRIFGATETDFGLFGALLDAFDRGETGELEGGQLDEAINAGVAHVADFYSYADRCDRNTK